MKIAEANLDLCEQAMAVLAVLANREMEDLHDDAEVASTVWMRTRAWYNGRERGVSLTAVPACLNDAPVLVIVFAECRNSDSLFVEVYESGHDHALYPPTVQSLGGEQGRPTRRKTFAPLRIDLAVDFIIKHLRAYVAKVVKADEKAQKAARKPAGKRK